MASFDFYDIEKLIKEGVNDELLKQILKEANRFKVFENTDLWKVCDRQGLPLLTPNRSSDWNEQIDNFIEGHQTFNGRFKVGDVVISHNATESADDWYKQLIA